MKMNNKFLIKLTGAIIIAVFTLTAGLCSPKKSEAELAQEARIAELEARLNALAGQDTEEAAELQVELETAQQERRERSERSSGSRNRNTGTTGSSETAAATTTPPSTTQTPTTSTQTTTPATQTQTPSTTTQTPAAQTQTPATQTPAAQTSVASGVPAGVNYEVIGNSVRIIDSSKAKGAIVIPATINGLPVTVIGDYAFNLSGLTSVTIPSGVTTIERAAFANSINLASVTLPPAITAIAENTFDGCKSLTTITIPPTVTTIGGSAFSSCMSLTTITIPPTVTTIGDYAFGDTGLTSITIPASVTRMNDNAFSGNPNMTAINVDPANTVFSSVDGVLFNKDKTRIIKYPDGKKGAYTVPSTVTSIAGVFGGYIGHKGLTSITIPSSMTTIPNNAFQNCSNLTSVTLPNTITSIGERAFMDTAIKSFTVPPGVTAGLGGIETVTALTEVIVASGNTAYSSNGGVLFDKSGQTLIFYPNAKGGAYTVPNTVTTIANGALGRPNITSITLPNSLTTISFGAFGSAGMRSITIPNSVTTIGRMAFYDCKNLESVTIGTIEQGNLDKEAFDGNFHELYFSATGGAGTYVRTTPPDTFYAYVKWRKQ